MLVRGFSLKGRIGRKWAIFLCLGVLLALSSLLHQASANTQVAQTQLLGGIIQKYVDPMPDVSTGRVNAKAITVSMEEVQQKVLPNSFYTALAAPYSAGTYVWAYNVQGKGALYPAYTIEAVRNTPTQVTYTNNLQQAGGLPPVLQQYLTVDQTIHWADPLMQMSPTNALPYTGPVPVVTHLHGGEVPSLYDGNPDAWFTPTGLHGPAYRTVAATTPNSAIYRYLNKQNAATLWFHDHALGATRLNVYGGLAGFYLLRDTQDTGLPTNPLNLPANPYEKEIVIQDRMFDTNGQWFFPDIGANPTVHPFWVPEFFGDVIVVNGKAWPYLNVEPRRYRFRLLNGSNARFYRLSIPGLTMWQIGTDGGLLDNPVQFSTLLLAPGERADIIIDFSPVAGKRLLVRNTAPAPYPGGAVVNTATVGQIMQFRVAKTATGADTSYNPVTGGALRAANPIQRLANPATGVANVVPDVTRQLTLNENLSATANPLEVLINNSKWTGLRPDNTPIPGATASMPTAAAAAKGNVWRTELPRVGATELWEIINLTVDAHPIHLHLVQFQLVNRQPFNKAGYTNVYNAAFPGGTYGGVTYAAGAYIPAFGPPGAYLTANAAGALGGNPNVNPYLLKTPAAPQPWEQGWKDTVVMMPNQVTRILVRFAPQDQVVGTTTPGVNTFPFDPTKGPGYVWHCHILDHEDNEMMRPYTPVP